MSVIELRTHRAHDDALYVEIARAERGMLACRAELRERGVDFGRRRELAQMMENYEATAQRLRATLHLDVATENLRLAA